MISHVSTRENPQLLGTRTVVDLFFRMHVSVQSVPRFLMLLLGLKLS